MSRSRSDKIVIKNYMMTMTVRGSYLNVNGNETRCFEGGEFGIKCLRNHIRNIRIF
jgi:hypothetical protein